MLRRIPVIAARAASLAFSALPLVDDHPHAHGFAIPGVYGVRAWGVYAGAGRESGHRIVEDTAR